MIYVLLMVGVLGARGAEFSLPLVVLLLLDVSTKTFLTGCALQSDCAAAPAYLQQLP